MFLSLVWLPPGHLEKFKRYQAAAASTILDTAETGESGFTLLSFMTALEVPVVGLSRAVVLEVAEGQPVEVCCTCDCTNCSIHLCDISFLDFVHKGGGCGGGGCGGGAGGGGGG